MEKVARTNVILAVHSVGLKVGSVDARVPKTDKFDFRAGKGELFINIVQDVEHVGQGANTGDVMLHQATSRLEKVLAARGRCLLPEDGACCQQMVLAARGWCAAD
jgi:hypothetical protein